MIVVIMGVSGSGKSTVGSLLAAQLGWTFLEGDDFHPPKNIEKMSKGTSLTDEDRLPWLRSLRTIIDSCVENGSDAVIACSALRKRYRRILADRIPEVHFVYLRGDPGVIRERMKVRRDHYMKSGMLDSQFASLEEPGDAIVVDIRNSPQEIVSGVALALGLAIADVR